MCSFKPTLQHKFSSPKLTQKKGENGTQMVLHFQVISLE